MKTILSSYQKFHDWWVHPQIKANPKKDEIIWESTLSCFMSLVFYAIMYSVYVSINYSYGVYACYVGVFQCFMTIVMSRYVSNVILIQILTTFLFAVVIFLVSLGDGGVWSVYHTGYIIMMLWMFKYGPKVGFGFLGFLICWFGLWLFLESYEMFQIIPMDEKAALIQRRCFVVIMLLGFAFYFYTKNNNEKRIRKKLKEIQSRIANHEKLASIGQLSSGIAHEINNPLNFIQNNTRALQLNLSDLDPILQALVDFEKSNSDIDKQKLVSLAKKIDVSLLQTESSELIEGVLSGTSRVDAIIKSMSYISRSDLEKESVYSDIHKPINSAIVILQSKIRDKINIETKFADLDPIKINPGQISQVIINILNNSIQAILDKGTVIIETKRINEFCEISIKDDGIGMDEKIKTRIFDQFFTTKDVGEGTGLGLSISYNIIKAHGGEILVESAPGKGTNIRILLPYS